jgi:CRP-like cAMP-binding protein
MRTTTELTADEPRNRILDSLSRTARETLPPLEEIHLRSGTVLYEPDKEIDFVYFLSDALVSIVSLNSEGATVEIGLIGHEGMVGVPAILGGVTPYRAVVQKGGQAFRMKRRHINDEFQRNRAFQEVLLKYANVFMIQVAQSSLCNCFHTLQERFCRWLLVARDGARCDTIPMTHDLIARLLGARRASITVAAGLLQRAGLIRTARGEITILDPGGLEEMACECYVILRDGLRRANN